jgi:hypothetical protein
MKKHNRKFKVTIVRKCNICGDIIEYDAFDSIYIEKMCCNRPMELVDIIKEEKSYIEND